MANFHVFAEMDKLAGKQIDLLSFGPKSTDEFRLTSSFDLTGLSIDVKAFAVVTGYFILQRLLEIHC